MERVGWREWVWLPELDIGPIKAKLDTGARTSAIHAYDIQRDGDQLSFKVHTIQGRDDFFIQATAAFVEERLVRDSGGKQTLRPIIRTPLRMGSQEWPIELSLIDRSDMKVRMLIGRSAVAGRFLVDSGTEYVTGIPAELENWSP